MELVAGRCCQSKEFSKTKEGKLVVKNSSSDSAVVVIILSCALIAVVMMGYMSDGGFQDQCEYL